MHTVIIQSTFKFCLRLEVADSVKAAADIPVILEDDTCANAYSLSL